MKIHAVVSWAEIRRVERARDFAKLLYNTTPITSAVCQKALRAYKVNNELAIELIKARNAVK